MKGLLVSLEKLFFYDYHKATEKIVSEIKHKKLPSHNTVIGYVVMEVVSPTEIKDFVEAIHKIKNLSYDLGIQQFKLILIPSYSFYKEELRDFDIEYFDSLANLIYNSYVKRSEMISKKWNYRSKKFLMLTGIPVRLNRVGLVYKAYEEKLLDHSIWSLFPPLNEEQEISCRQILSKLSDLEYEKFRKVGFKKIDNISTESYQNVVKTGYEDLTAEIFPDYFKKTSFSVISETYFSNYHPKRDISEKIWRAIINRHPFIIAGTQGLGEYLSQKGFKNYINYLDENYDQIVDDDSRLDAVIKCSKFFLNNITHNKDEIKKDVEHNYQTFVAMVVDQKNYFEQFFKSYHIHQKEIDLILNTTNYWHIADEDFWKDLDNKQKNYAVKD